MIRPERIQPTLRDRVFPVFRFRNDQTWSAVFLVSGSATVTAGGTAIWLEAPGIFWAEATGDQSLRIDAGSEGYQVSVAAQVLLNAIGHNPESIELRKLADRNLVVRLATEQATVGAVERGREVQEPVLETPGSVRDAMVIDFATGSGLVAIAASTTAERSSVLRVAVSKVRIPRSHRITRWLPPAITYSAACKSSLIVADMPRFNRIGRSTLPSSLSLGA